MFLSNWPSFSFFLRTLVAPSLFFTLLLHSRFLKFRTLIWSDIYFSLSIPAIPFVPFVFELSQLPPPLFSSRVQSATSQFISTQVNACDYCLRRTTPLITLSCFSIILLSESSLSLRSRSLCSWCRLSSSNLLHLSSSFSRFSFSILKELFCINFDLPFRDFVGPIIRRDCVWSDNFQKQPKLHGIAQQQHRKLPLLLKLYLNSQRFLLRPSLFLLLLDSLHCQSLLPLLLSNLNLFFKILIFNIISLCSHKFTYPYHHSATIVLLHETLVLLKLKKSLPTSLVKITSIFSFRDAKNWGKILAPFVSLNNLSYYMFENHELFLCFVWLECSIHRILMHWMQSILFHVLILWEHL